MNTIANIVLQGESNVAAAAAAASGFPELKITVKVKKSVYG